MTAFTEVFASVLKKIDSADIPYMIVGSIASTIYGEPRLTKDMDLVLDILPEKSLTFSQLFQQPEFYCPPSEILNDEILNHGQFNLLHPESGLKVDIMVRKKSAFDEECFKRRKKIELWNGFFAYVASPEDVIIKKLEYYIEGQSEKHVRDIRGILANTPIDQTYLQTWIKKLNLADAWLIFSQPN